MATRGQLSEKQLESFNLGRQIKDQSGKLSPGAAQKIFDEMLANTASQVGPLRAEAAKQARLQAAFERTGQADLAAQAGEARGVAVGGLNQIVAARSISQLGNVASLFENVPFGGGAIKQAILDAQKTYIANTIQKVRIVEIDE